MLYIKTPSGNKIYNVISVGINGKNIIYGTPNNHDVLMEYPSEEYARSILNLITLKIANNENMLDLMSLRLPEQRGLS